MAAAALRTPPPASSSRRFTLGDTLGFPPGRRDARDRSAPGGSIASASSASAAYSDVFVSACEAGFHRAGQAARRRRMLGGICMIRYNRFSVRLGFSRRDRKTGQRCRTITSRVFSQVLDAFQDDRAGVADGIENVRPNWPSRSCRGRAGR